MVRVLTVDDSPIFREVLRDVLEAEGDISVVAEAADGDDALRQVRAHRPDLVTLDLQMPGADGLAAIEQIMAEVPVPILVVTSLPTRGERNLAFEATRRGALEILEKRAVSGGGPATARLRDEIRALSRVRVVRRPSASRPRVPAVPRLGTARHVAARAPACTAIGLGASAGGPPAIAQILAELPLGLPACVVVVQHIALGFAPFFARFLQESTPWKVVLADRPVTMAPGTVIVAADDRHVVAEGDSVFAPSSAPPVGGFRPSIDHLFTSLARAHGSGALGVLLTGLGADGARGLLDLRRAGATTLVQDKQTSAVFGMPSAALSLGAAERAVPLPDMASAIAAAVSARQAVGAP
jgi:two-component system chemotaxis response regulator CheB